MTSEVMAPVIREMTMDDLPIVLEIDRLSFPLPWSERTYRFELEENQAAVLFVAEAPDNGASKVVGYIGLWFVVDEAHISTIAVHPNYRRHGLGEALLQHGLEYASENGAAMVTLEVRVSNQAALNLYDKYGFKVIGSRPRYYRDNNEDAYIMARNSMKRGSVRQDGGGKWSRQRP
jgi:ribosomal-protein-alanine N-acetyltransferase